MKKKNLYRQLCGLRRRAERTGVHVQNPTTTIEKTTSGTLVLQDQYGNRYQETCGQEVNGRFINVSIEGFPESFPKIELSRLIPPLRMADQLGRSTEIKLKKREFQLHIGGSYIVNLPFSRS